MVKKKLFLIIISVILLGTLFLPMIQALNTTSSSNLVASTYQISTESNFFGQVEDTTTVELDLNYETTLLTGGYKLVSETDSIILYVKEKNFNIAVVDKSSGYVWYSIYKDYRDLGLSGTSLFFLDSGITIEYFNLDNILIDTQKSYLSGSKYNVDIEYNYDTLDHGVVAHVTFNDLAIEFDVLVSISGDHLNVKLPMDSLVEGEIKKNVLNIDGTVTEKVTKYRLKAVYLFPYFGSENYEINGYSMIPDGSGALIRYTDIKSSTAYTKRIYGSDEGLLNFKTDSTTYYLQDELTASMPIFGVNHGYHQAAFLAVLTEGDGYAELDSYPYGYNAYYLNTTFFKFIVRERYTIQTSSSSSDSFQLINEDPYPTDFSVDYYFLSNDKASYSGMAERYKEVLEIKQKTASSSKLHLSLIGMDYKNGLLGKNFVVMTDYEDVTTLTKELTNLGITDIDITYIGWSKGGYYDNTPIKAVVSSKMGGKSDFTAMMNYLDEIGADISFYTDPLIAFSDSLGNGVVKKLTLKIFETDYVKSSLFSSVYFKDPLEIANTVLKEQTRYQKLAIDSLSIGTIGNALFSYRSNQTNHYRQETIQTIVSQVEALSDYQIALYQPNAYLWSSITTYYDAPIESNKYAYITDSIPFVEMVLSGSVNLMSPYINYVSDYELFTLRLVEYGITPSFLLTKESTHHLRYTNFAYVYTSEYDLWKPVIEQVSATMDEALTKTEGLYMVNHRYILPGVAEVTYDNGLVIYVNYTNDLQVVYVGMAVAPLSYRVVMPS